MLGREVFYYGLIRRYTVLFATLFNEIKVPRYAQDGSERELVRVPISLGPRDKTLARIFGDGGANSRPEAVTLPRLSFDMAAPRYDSSRHQSAAETITVYTANTYSKMFTPVPYDFDFNLYCYTKTQEDGLKIIEQILPFFTPEFTVRAELIPSVVTMNVPIVLNSVNVQDDYDAGEIKDRRAVIWTLGFTVKGWLYGPEHVGGVIKFIDVPLYVPRQDTSIDDTTRFNTGAIDEVTVQPGLLANGSPTTNTAASVPYTQVQIDDNWAYAVWVAGNLDPTEGTGGA